MRKTLADKIYEAYKCHPSALLISLKFKVPMKTVEMIVKKRKEAENEYKRD